VDVRQDSPQYSGEKRRDKLIEMVAILNQKGIPVPEELSSMLGMVARSKPIPKMGKLDAAMFEVAESLGMEETIPYELILEMDHSPRFPKVKMPSWDRPVFPKRLAEAQGSTPAPSYGFVRPYSRLAKIGYGPRDFSRKRREIFTPPKSSGPPRGPNQRELAAILDRTRTK